MMLDLPELLAPAIIVSGAMRSVWASEMDLNPDTEISDSGDVLIVMNGTGCTLP